MWFTRLLRFALPTFIVFILMATIWFVSKQSIATSGVNAIPSQPGAPALNVQSATQTRTVSTVRPVLTRTPEPVADEVTIHEVLPAFCNREPGGIYEILVNDRVVCSSNYIGKADFVLREITNRATICSAQMRVNPSRVQQIDWHQCSAGRVPAIVRDNSVWEGERVCVAITWSEGADPSPHISFFFAGDEDRRYLYQESGIMDNQSKVLINNNVYTLPMIPGQDGRLELMTGYLIDRYDINPVIESLPFTEYSATVDGLDDGARLRIRAGPGEQYDIISHLDPSEQVRVIRPGWFNSIDNAVWREIRTVSGREGWVNGDYLDVPRSRN